MGKGSLNRLLLSSKDCTGADPHTTCYELDSRDPRSLHIRTLLAKAQTFTLRVAVEPSILHDSAIVTILPCGKIRLLIPHSTSRSTPPPPPVALLIAMQRPKVMGRVLEAAAAIGVSVICVLAADKVEKSYWDCKLFRDKSSTDNTDNHSQPPLYHDDNKDSLVQHVSQNIQTPASLPGRPRGMHNHPRKNHSEISNPSITRVDHVPSVRRRLLEAVQQANADANLPVVMLERRGLSAVMDTAHPVWDCVPFNSTKVVAHPYLVQNAQPAIISSTIAHSSHQSAVLAIGPEGGWVDAETEQLTSNSFTVASLGERVLRSETATIIALGLVHEGLRMKKGIFASKVPLKKQTTE